MSKLFLQTVLACFSVLSAASWGQSDADFNVDPVMTYFGSVNIGSASTPAFIRFKNTQATDNLVIDGGASLTGPEADQFLIVDDDCANKSLSPGAGCMVEVSYKPTTFGSHLAAVVLSVPSNSGSPVMSAFVASEEDVVTEGERRLPEVIYTLDLSASYTGAEDLPIAWSVLGYNRDYVSTVAIFDCTGVAAGGCGENFADNIWSSGAIEAVGTSSSSQWRYRGQNASIFEYVAAVPVTILSELPIGSTEIVVRFYGKSGSDVSAQRMSTSLIIPGNLGINYYATEGRRALIFITN